MRRTLEKLHTWRPIERLSALGAPDDEPTSQRHARQILVFGGALMSGGGVSWGVAALALGLAGPSVIPLGYAAITAVNLAVFARTRRFGPARNVQVFISLLLPFAFQWSLGGFSSSGSVMSWAMIALVASLSFSTMRQSLVWIALFSALTIASGLVDASLVASTSFDPPMALRRAFLVFNTVTITSIVFGLATVLAQRQRTAIRELEAEQETNRRLNRELERTIEARERDIVELRATQASLGALTTSLEAQVEARTRELARAAERAEAGTRAKSEFLAVMSHEMRTPLNGILATVDLLGLTRLDDDQRQNVRLLRRSGELLLTIITDVLDFSRVEAGRLELAPRPFDLRAELTGLVEVHRAEARATGVELVLELPEALPSPVFADPDRLLQVLGNLVGNAIKFTKRGSITVTLAVEEDDCGFRLELRVADTGIGIASQDLPRLFQPFSQVDSSSTRRFGGTGLGLAICARLVELMEGSISVTSAVGRGTTFTFDVRAARPPSSPGVQDHAPAPKLTDGAGLRVLLAEDNPVNQLLGVKLLERAGCTVRLAGDGAAAVELVEAEAFDLVLLDVQMPVLDGLGAARRINELGLERRPRIVAVTASAFASDRQASFDAGMDAFLTKPLRLDALLAELRHTRALGAARDGDR
ncbi:ATP-binding protein [Myxococcota bacterium]|nr:ATP-binding protein [Myxococcota bacterium]